jgi:hypothetical protein
MSDEEKQRATRARAWLGLPPDWEAPRDFDIVEYLMRNPQILSRLAVATEAAIAHLKTEGMLTVKSVEDVEKLFCEKLTAEMMKARPLP